VLIKLESTAACDSTSSDALSNCQYEHFSKPEFSDISDDEFVQASKLAEARGSDNTNVSRPFRYPVSSDSVVDIQREKICQKNGR
jgi:hypothetical protein